VNVRNHHYMFLCCVEWEWRSCTAAADTAPASRESGFTAATFYPGIRSRATRESSPCDQGYDHTAVPSLWSGPRSYYCIVLIPHQNQDHNTVLTLWSEPWSDCSSLHVIWPKITLQSQPWYQNHEQPGVHFMSSGPMSHYSPHPDIRTMNSLEFTSCHPAQCHTTVLTLWSEPW